MPRQVRWRDWARRWWPRTWKRFRVWASALPPGVVFELGGHREASFEECDLLVVSPGIPATNRYIALARASGAEVIGEVELACRLCSAPIAAVTGTNGKTTVTTMLGADSGGKRFSRACGRKHRKSARRGGGGRGR